MFLGGHATDRRASFLGQRDPDRAVYSKVNCRERLGGLLRDYYRDAA